MGNYSINKIQSVSIWLIFLIQLSGAAALYRVNSSYEDSVRIAFIWNDATGSCGDETSPVGEKTLAFALKSIDTSIVRNVKSIKNSQSDKTTWNDIVSLWGDSLLPHAIVHVNAGWSYGWNEKELDTIFSNAVQNKIGIVSIGDDAASLGTTAFGFDSIDNAPAPLGDAMGVDSLWLGLLRNNDEKLKIYTSGTILQYPGLNGIISNAADSILKGNVLTFFPVGEGRCQADADKYNVLYPQWITMLAYQQGYDDGALLNGPDELNVLVAIQDTIKKKLIRRAVALSFQPQFLRDSIAVEQITYDAIMFASLTHTLSVASKMFLRVDSDTLRAGENVNITAELFDQYNEKMDEKSGLVKWIILDGVTGDTLTFASGGSTALTAARAWRTVTVQADFYDPETGASVSTSAKVYVMPGDPHHLDIRNSPDIKAQELNSDAPQIFMTFTKADHDTSVFAIVRDRFGNYVKPAYGTVEWVSGNLKVVNVSSDNSNIAKGVIVKIDGGNTAVYVNSPGLLSDSLGISVADNNFVDRAYTRDTDGNGFIDMIEVHFDSIVIIASMQSPFVNIAVSYDNKNFVITGIAAQNGISDSIINIKVNEDTSGALQTALICDVKGTIPLYINDKSDIYNVSVNEVTIDGAGPVLQRALYFYNDNPALGDTLLLVLSEPVKRESLVNLLPEKSFVYYCCDNNMKETAILINSIWSIRSDRDYIDTVRIAADMSIVNKYGITLGDLMQFVDNGTDISGNAAPSKDLSRKTAVEFMGSNNIVTAVYPNPYNIDKIKIADFPQSIRNTYKDLIGNYDEGMIITVTAKKNLKKNSSGFFGQVIIYDAVGNIVVKGISLRQVGNSLEYGFIWNCANENKRRVAAGTYLMVVKVTSADNGEQMTDSKKIGITLK